MSRSVNDFRGGSFVQERNSDSLDRKLSNAAEESAHRAGEAAAKAIANRLGANFKVPKTA